MAFIFGTVALALAACREWPEPAFEETHALPNVSLGDLRAYLDGNTTGSGAETTLSKEEIMLSGRVVSSDRAGNFYNTFFIDDGTGAAEIMAGMTDLDAGFHPGQRVFVAARGLAVGWRDGAMQLGLPPEPGNRYATGYFYHRAVMQRWVTAERSVEEVAPLDIELGALSVGLCGRLVRVSGLTVDPLSRETWATVIPERETGYVKFRGTAADSITVVTSGYASWAAANVPRGEVTLTGILFYGRGGASRNHFLLKLRDEKDIDF
ncbi:MAG: DUF5689 domain-containing protein [Alistipes sp.]|nr:DUF5689 domain-containing protein [Alistipes sp.]